MTNNDQEEMTLDKRSYRILEIGAEYMKISKEELLRQIVDCIEIDIEENQILNRGKLEEFGFDYHMINILKLFLGYCYKKQYIPRDKR